MKNGWIKLHRSLFDNPCVTQSSEHLTIWLYLMTHATPRPYKTYFAGQEITLQAGQLITSRKSIAKCVNSGISDSKVHRVLKAFENAHQIEQQTSNKNRLITLLNWDKYQMGEHQNEQPVNNRRTTNEQQLNTNREYKNIDNSNIKNIYTVEIGKILSYLNKKAGTNYASNEKNTIELINARMKEGYTVADFEKVIDNKCADWLGTEWAKYLRPSTLFGEKFESYLKAPAPAAKKNKRGSMYSSDGASFDVAKYEKDSLFND